MSLNDIIGHIIELYDIGNQIETHKAVQAAFPLVLADEEARDQIILEGLSKRIKDMATRAHRKSDDDPDKQTSFFGDRLRQRYALDVDGRVIKDTDAMSRIEFERLIAIREKQMDADAAHLNVLKAAREALAPFWDAHPDYTYGQAEREYLRGRAA